MCPPRLVSNRCEPHVSLWFAPTFDLPSSLAATDTLRGASLSSCLPQLVCVCASFWCRDYTLCESAFLFAPFNTEVASIIQQHIAEHNATHCIALSPSRVLSIYLPPVRLFLCPHYVSLAPLPQSSQLCPLYLSPHSCHVSPTRAENLSDLSLFLAFISVCFLLFPPLLLLIFFHILYALGISLLVCLVVSTPSLLIRPFLLKSCQGSFEGPERRPWRGAGRKGSGRPHCSTPLCWTDFSLWHTHHEIGHTRCAESLTPCSLSSRQRGVFSWYQGRPFLSADSFVFYHVSDAHETPGSHGVRGQEDCERETQTVGYNHQDVIWRCQTFSLIAWYFKKLVSSLTLLLREVKPPGQLSLQRHTHSSGHLLAVN